MSKFDLLASIEAIQELENAQLLMVRAVLHGRTIKGQDLREQAQILTAETVKEVSDLLHVSRASARDLLASYVSSFAQQELGLHE